jgi:spore maturation protein CgeB
MKSGFVKVTSFYKDFLDYYYRSNPWVISKNYREQYQHLMDQGYGYSDYFPRYLKQNHDISGTELIHNATHLQAAWARENGFKFEGDRLLLEQLKTCKPEILFIQDSINFNAAFVQKIKEEVRSIRLIIGHCCAPYNQENIRAFKQYDVILACSEKFLEDFRQQDIRCYLFPHAVESSLVKQLGGTPDPVNEIIFVGSLLQRSEFHNQRISYLEKILSNHLPLRMYGQLETDTGLRLRTKQAAYLLVRLLASLQVKSIYQFKPFHKIGLLKEMPHKSNYSSVIKKNFRIEHLFGIEMLRKIAEYSVGFNLHGEVAGDYAANVRMFEVTGAGSLLVTDHKKNIASLFEPDKEILTYKNVEECIEKLQWALNHPLEARAIARTGQKRALMDHTVEKRVDLLYEIIQKEL